MTQHLELDTHLAGRHLLDLRQQLQALLREDPELHVDCHRVLHLSAAGQALLLATGRTAARRGGRLLLHTPSPQMRQALRSTGLDHLLTPPSPAAARR